MNISKETTVILDALASLGNVVEIIDTEGVYHYCSENSNFANIPAKEMIGMNMKDIYGLTDETSQVMQVIRTGVPKRDILFDFVSIATGKRHIWLYNAYPYIIDGKLLGAIVFYKSFSTLKSIVHEYTGNEVQKYNIPAVIARKAHFYFSDIVYASASMEKAITLGKKVARHNSSVLLIGETGTGKELFAQSIHAASSKSDKPFVAVNCAAIPDTLLESILFGVAKGAYTGAIEKPGLFEQSSEGTIFLDEIHTLTPEMQAKLLRVLEYKVVRRVGGSKEIPVDPRIITTINVNPFDHIKAGKMKLDLFYRIAVVTIDIPPLRNRIKDIPLLVNHFIKSINRKMNTHVERCSDEVMHQFENYEWPGNVRELQHCIEHAMTMVDDGIDTIQTTDLPRFFGGDLVEKTYINQDQTPVPNVQQILRKQEFKKITNYKEAHKNAMEQFNNEFNKHYITHSLSASGHNITKAASGMGISRQYLYELMKKYNCNVE